MYYTPVFLYCAPDSLELLFVWFLPLRAELCLPIFMCRSPDSWFCVTGLEIGHLEVIKLNGVLRVGPNPIWLAVLEKRRLRLTKRWYSYAPGEALVRTGRRWPLPPSRGPRTIPMPTNTSASDFHSATVKDFLFLFQPIIPWSALANRCTVKMLLLLTQSKLSSAEQTWLYSVPSIVLSLPRPFGSAQASCVSMQLIFTTTLGKSQGSPLIS